MSQFSIKKAGWVLLALPFLFWSVDRTVHRFSGGGPGDIINYETRAEWEVASRCGVDFATLAPILNQTFTYFNKGSQSYVYLSGDGQYVLKFLKQNKWRPKTLLAHLPFAWNPLYKKQCVLYQKRERTFSAIQTALEHFQEKTGIVYAHLNRTHGKCQKIHLIDRKGKEHWVDLDTTSFLVQKRAQLIYPRIDALIAEGAPQKAEGVISSVFALLKFLGEQGVVDNDPILRKNFGLIDDEAIQIDIGRMRIDPSRVQGNQYRGELASITHSFKVWITKNHPSLLPHFEKTLNEGLEDSCLL